MNFIVWKKRIVKKGVCVLLLLSAFTLLSDSQCSAGGKNQQNSTNGWISPGDNFKWLLSWTKSSPLTIPRGSAPVVEHNGYIYILGGGGINMDQSIIHASVEFAKIQQDGSLGLWTLTSPMKTKRVFSAAVVAYGYIYVIGGEKGYEPEDLLNTIEKAKILKDGSLGEWEFTKQTLNTPRRGLYASYYNGSIYAFGGFNGTFLHDMEQAKVNQDNTLEEWIYEEEQAINERYVHSGVINKKHVYLFGGHTRSPQIGTETAEWASINDKGKIAGWKPLPPMPTSRFGGDAVVVHDTVYVLGGHNTIPLSSVDKATLLPEGGISTWKRDTPLTDNRVGAGVLSANNVIYVIGGSNEGEYLRTVLRAYYSKGMPLGKWTNDNEEIQNALHSQNPLPKDAEKHFQLGWKSLQHNDLNGAITEYVLGLKVKDIYAQPHSSLATAYHKHKMYENAIAEYKKAIAIAPTFAHLYFNLGNSYFALENLVESETSFRKAIWLEPGFTNAKIRLSQVLVKEERCNDAEQYIQELSNTLPDSKIVKLLATDCSLNK